MLLAAFAVALSANRFKESQFFKSLFSTRNLANDTNPRMNVAKAPALGEFQLMEVKVATVDVSSSVWSSYCIFRKTSRCLMNYFALSLSEICVCLFCYWRFVLRCEIRLFSREITVEIMVLKTFLRIMETVGV
jgi:hypothetical protein